MTSFPLVVTGCLRCNNVRPDTFRDELAFKLLVVVIAVRNFRLPRLLGKKGDQHVFEIMFCFVDLNFMINEK